MDSSDPKRRCVRHDELSLSNNIASANSPLTTDMDIMVKTKQMMENVKIKIQAIKNVDQPMTQLKSYIVDAISKMDPIDKDNKRKVTIGIFGKSGHGKSSLLNAVLGEEDLLPPGCSGACTAVVTQVEANLDDSNYKAEIELFSKEEWDNMLQDHFNVLSDKSEHRDDEMFETAKDKITALYGADADKKTLEQLKKDVKFAEISDFLSKPIKTISNSQTLSKCFSVWIVSDINRAITDKEPWGILKHCIQDLGPAGECESINFICTKTETDINPVTYIRNARLTREQISGSGLDPTAVCILHRNNSTKELVKTKLDSLNPVTKKLMEKFSTDVFTVSSQAFSKQNSNLDHTETEIPRLQEVLKSINKSINQELTRNYVNDAKGVLSLIQFFSPKTNQVDTKVLEDLKNNLTEALKEIDCLFDKCHESLDKCLSEGVANSVKLSAATAQKELINPDNIDNRGFHQTLKALCQNRGYYWSKNWAMILDLNDCLATHMHESLNEEFNDIFPVNNKSEKSLKVHLDRVSIIQRDNTSCRSTVTHHIQNFIITRENKLKASLRRKVMDKKKEMHSSISIVIQEKMSAGYKKAAKAKGKGSLKKMQDILTDTITSLKDDMFNDAKTEFLDLFKTLKLYIKDAFDTELKKSMKPFHYKTGKTTLLDVSIEIEQLERLAEQLSN
ncbi:hypothetical protein R3I94_018714 [Phoxinus phoxinus]